MLKQIVKRGFLGIPLGIAISFIVTVIISLFINDGLYHPVVPALANQFGGELNAVVFQTALAASQGAAIGAATVIWDTEKWSLPKQTGIFFLVLSAIALPTAYLAHWMPRSGSGFLLYVAIFITTYMAICTINYLGPVPAIRKCRFARRFFANQGV